MLWSQFAALLPSLFIHLFATVCFAGAAWYLVSKEKPEWRIPWTVPVIIAAAFSLYSSAASVIGLYQNQVLFKLQQAQAPLQASGQASGQGPGQAAPTATAQNSAPVDPKLQMKSDFLKRVDELTASDEPISPASVKDLETKFAPLFPKGELDRTTFANAVLGVYQCQQYFFEDALSSYKFKKSVKSDDREHCEKADGSFFNRALMIPPDVAKGNSDAIELLAGRKPLTDSAGKAIEVNETTIRSKLEAQMHRVAAAKRIFAQMSNDGGPRPASAH